MVWLQMLNQRNTKILGRIYKRVEILKLALPFLYRIWFTYVHLFLKLRVTSTTWILQVEPGPADGPGIRYESLGSSFGNFGQPPWDSHVSVSIGSECGHGKLNGVQTSPAKAAGVPLPASPPPSAPATDMNPFQVGFVSIR